MDVLAHTEDWVVVSGADAGVDRDALARRLGDDPGLLTPIFESDRGVPGIQVLARSSAAHDRLLAALSSSDTRIEFRAITAPTLWRDGTLDEPFGKQPGETRFERTGVFGPHCEVAVTTSDGSPERIRFHLARAGYPVAGDTRVGGEDVKGGLRLRRAILQIPSLGIDCRAAEPGDWWPEASLGPREGSRPTLGVSRATVLALRSGHPWILPDDETSDFSKLAPGTLVDVVDPRGKAAGTARIEGRGRVAARLWSRAEEGGRVASVEARVAAALSKRRALLAEASTDALRLLHGEADGLPGLAVDRLGPLLRILVTGRACEPVVERAIDALLRQLSGVLGGDPPVVRVVHLADPPSGRLRAVELVRGSLETGSLTKGRLAVRENGLVFDVDPGLSNPEHARPGTGFFLDQRDNRARVRDVAAGGRWLNLFCHTGAFSIAALAGGAREVVSVDLSASYLGWLDDNLRINELADAPHRSVRKDVRQFLARLAPDERFDGIVLDPPTAAHVGRRFWSIRREGGAMLGECLGRLRPGGMLLASRNDRAARGTLAQLVREVADTAGIELASVEDAPPSPDFPRMAGFPEGDAFEAVVATRRA